MNILKEAHETVIKDIFDLEAVHSRSLSEDRRAVDAIARAAKSNEKTLNDVAKKIEDVT